MKKKRHSGFIMREDIRGDKPLYHLFYAQETKSKQFATKKEAEKWRKKYL